MIMKTKTYTYSAFIVILLVAVTACKAPDYGRMDPKKDTPESYLGSTDTTNLADIAWKDYFKDTCLTALIDSALVNNQELNIFLMEMHISQNEVMARKGEYLPSVGIRAGGGADKVGRYTTQGAMEATTELEPGKEIPEVVPDMLVGAYANWEIDIWGKLRNAKKAAAKRYLSSVEGRNFMVTNMVGEISNSYYELLALDRRLEIIDRYIDIQTNALRIVKLQKENAKVTELAVRKFEAEVYSTKSMRYDVQQQIIETENRINFLVGRYPQHVERNSNAFDELYPTEILTGVPSQLLDRRTDVRKAELELQACKLDVKSTKAAFYPSLGIKGGIGLNALNPTYIIRPQSIIFNVAGDLVAPLVNRKAIKAKYYNANAQQVQAVYSYEKTLLTAYIEVYNELNNINNLQQSFELKSKQVEALTDAIKVSNDLFASARADYMEILMTQRDALGSKMELVETKMQQLQARVNVYRALGGGWK